MEAKKPSGRGGARPGAGRKPTTRNVRETAADVILKRRAEGGKEPMQVMLEAMDEAYAQGGALAAFPLAKECAPYMHPKLASAEVKAEAVITARTLPASVHEFV